MEELPGAVGAGENSSNLEDDAGNLRPQKLPQHDLTLREAAEQQQQQQHHHDANEEDGGQGEQALGDGDAGASKNSVAMCIADGGDDNEDDHDKKQASW